jgi:hypothetical protein
MEGMHEDSDFTARKVHPSRAKENNYIVEEATRHVTEKS